MLFNLALVVIFALVLYMFFELIKLPGILGLILTGILLGPSVLNFISPDVLKLSTDLRSMALIIILIRISFSIKKSELNQIGPVSIKMGILPVLIETCFIALFAIYILNFPYLMAFMLGLIISSVSPAIVVPQMMELKEKAHENKKHIPSILLAGAALDNILVLTLFNSFIQIYQGQNDSVFSSLIKIPLGLSLGALLGISLGYLFIKFFKKYHVQDSKKIIIFLLIAIILFKMESFSPLSISGLVAIMSMGFIILEKYEVLAHRLSLKFSKIWVLAEIILFVLVGAQVDLNSLITVGPYALVLIAIGLLGRSAGVFLALKGQKLSRNENLFCLISFIPKATVQAALGAIPLSLGLPHGDVILAISVLSIIITAPLGALGIRLAKKTIATSSF